MILSDRVIGNISIKGLLLAGVFITLSLPLSLYADEPDQRVVVSEVIAESSVGKAGVKPVNVVVCVQGVGDIHQASDLVDAIDMSNSRDLVLDIFRGSPPKPMQATITPTHILLEPNHEAMSLLPTSPMAIRRTELIKLRNQPINSKYRNFRMRIYSGVHSYKKSPHHRLIFDEKVTLGKSFDFHAKKPENWPANVEHWNIASGKLDINETGKLHFKGNVKHNSGSAVWYKVSIEPGKDFGAQGCGFGSIIFPHYVRFDEVTSDEFDADDPDSKSRPNGHGK